MKLKSWVTSLAVLCVVAATPADAAKISFSDQGWIDAGALIQTWARVTQNGAATKDNPSYDIFLRRARLLLSGQFNNYIGFIASTDVSYGALGNAAAPADTIAAQNAVRFHSPVFVINEILGTLKLCKEFEFDAGLMLIPWTHEALTSSARFANMDEQADVTKRGYPAGIQGRGRDVGLLIRGLLTDFIYYRIGVFNGVQTANGVAGTPAVPAGLTGVNPGDSLNIAGTIRLNILGKEDGYAFCGVCFATSPLFSIGFGADIQPRAVRAPTRTSNGGSYQGYFADLFLDLPFGDNEFVLEGAWVRTVYQGNGGVPLNSATSLNLINNAGNGFYGHIGVRIAWVMPIFSMEYYNSNLSEGNITSTTLGFAGGQAGGRVGDLTTYRIGLNFYPEKNTFNIKFELALQNKQNTDALTVSSPTVPIYGNQWAFTTQFQWAM